MKASDVYLRAAEMIANGEQEFVHRVIRGILEAEKFDDLFDQHDGKSFFMSRQHRVVSLCLMSAIAEYEERK